MSAGGRASERACAGSGALWRYGLLTVGAFATLLPFADMILGALRTPADLLARPPVYLPHHPAWGNFARAFTELPMGRWFLNSVVVTGAVTLIQLATSAAAGFAFAKYRFALRGALFRMVLGAQMFPFFLLIIPVFFLLRFWPLAGGNDLTGNGGHGLLGSYAALILPFGVSWYGVFLMRQFMLGVPDELLDAARIDGASELGLLVRVALPLVKPALATLGVFVFIYQWNEVLWTMTVTRSAPALQTVPVGIYLLRGAFNDIQQHSLQQAALVISVVPVVALFLCLQRFYVRSLAMTGMVG
ncbi:MAG: carbohydrate ABC transporter permease [Acetobacteraceae bacterium]|nr:carbohydrate ABC transporter permease [Acetobacteraceae bacterium]